MTMWLPSGPISNAGRPPRPWTTTSPLFWSTTTAVMVMVAWVSWTASTKAVLSPPALFRPRNANVCDPAVSVKVAVVILA